MDKSKITLSIVAGGLIIALFMLPRVVIKPQNEETIPSASTEKKDHLHTIRLKSKDSLHIVDFLSILKKEPQNIAILDSIGSLYSKNALFDSAIVYYQLLAEKEKSINAKIKLADAYYGGFSVSEGVAKEKYAEKSQIFYNEILSKDSMNLDIRAKYAMTLAVGSSPMKAVIALRKNLDKNPAHELTLFNLGLLSMQSGQYQKAVDRFERLIKINTSNPQAYYYLGLSYKQLGNKDSAKKMLLKAAEISNDPAVDQSVNESLSDM